MRVQVSSWILAALYVVYGVVFFNLYAPIKEMYSLVDVPLPLLTRLVIGPGPYFWLLFALAMAIVIVVKDSLTRERWPNKLFSVLLVCVVLTVAFAFFSPFVGVSKAIEK